MSLKSRLSRPLPDKRHRSKVSQGQAIASLQRSTLLPHPLTRVRQVDFPILFSDDLDSRSGDRYAETSIADIREVPRFRDVISSACHDGDINPAKREQPDVVLRNRDAIASVDETCVALGG